MTKKPLDRLHLLLGLALVVALMVAVVVWWLIGNRQPGVTPVSSGSPVQTSPLPAPTVVSAGAPSPVPWSRRGAALLWVVLGGLLALVMAFFILRRYRQDA